MIINLMKSRLYDATQVFFMGVGDAYLGLVDLLSHNGKYLSTPHRTPTNNRPENCTDPDSIVECLIGFVADTTIQSIKRATDDTISDWYYAVRPPSPSPCSHNPILTSPSIPEFSSKTAISSGTQAANANSAANSATWCNRRATRSTRC
jgi:hypothetical protein